MKKSPLEFLKEHDEQIIDGLMKTRDAAFTEGALSAKTKTLIAMAIDVVIGAEEGVKFLAKDALKLGATKEQIMEVIRVVSYIRGASGVYSAARALQEVFED